MSKILNSNYQSIKSLNEDILKGNICIGNKNDKIWKNIEENISMMNDEHINDIPEKIALNNQTIKNIDGEIKSLKKRKKKLIKENNNYLQRPFGYYIYKDKIPKLKEITSNIIKLEDHLSSQLYDFMNDDEKKENQNEFINLNDSLQFYKELHHDKFNEFKQYILSNNNIIEQIKNIIIPNIDKFEEDEDEQYKITRFISSISMIQNNDNIEYSTIRNNYLTFIEYFKSIDSIEFIKNEEKELLKSFIFNINELLLNEDYLISSSIKIPGVSLSLILNMCSISPSIIDKLKSMNGNRFISCDLRNEFKTNEDFQSFEYFEFLDLLYCQKIIKENLFPFQNHQSIKSIEDLENEFIDINEKEEEKEEYIVNDNRFIIYEHIKIFKKLIDINNQQFNENDNNNNHYNNIDNITNDELFDFDRLPFKIQFKFIIKEFIDIEMKFNEIPIENTLDENNLDKSIEEQKQNNNEYCIIIDDLKKLENQLKYYFQSAIHEGDIKYGYILDEFAEITLKLKKRIEEKEYIDENSFIIYEHIKTSKKLIEYNDKHIGIEKCNIGNDNFDDLPFKFKFKYLLNQFEDIEIKFNDLHIKQQNENNIEKQQNEEEKEIMDNYFCIKGLELINDINNIIKQLNRCFIEYINDKSIKYENIILENHFNRKYNEFLDEFTHIYSKIIFRKEENERKYLEKQKQSNIIMNNNLIDKNENYISILNNQCKICCCKNIKELILLFKDNEITLENGNTYSMYNAFIDCMKENNDEEKHSILKRILKMKLNGSRLIMITKQDIENPYFPIKFINHENQSIFLQIILKLNHFHDDSFKKEEFECIEWKDEYYESKHIFTEIDEIDDIEEETIKEEQFPNEIIENENDIKHEDSTKEVLIFSIANVYGQMKVTF